MKTPAPLPTHVNPDDQANVARWCEHFGVTPQQLAEAVNAAGNEPQAVRRHLLEQGASAGPG